MEVHRRTEITVEKEEVLVVKRARIYRAWCRGCGCEVDMVGITDALAVAGMAGQAGELSTSPSWHVFRDGIGELVCLESLLKSM